MKDFLKRISGHKTQLMSILTLVVGFMTARGYIAQDISELLFSVLGVLLTGTIGHGIKKKGLFNKNTK